MDDDKEVMEALPKIDEALADVQVSGTGEAAAAPAAIDPCRIYNQLKPHLPRLIRLAARIPVIGSRIAQALTLLQQLGEKCCR